MPVAERTPAQLREHSEHRKEAEAVRASKGADQLRAQQGDSFARGSFDLMQVCSHPLWNFNMRVTPMVDLRLLTVLIFLGWMARFPLNVFVFQVVD